MRRLLSRGVYIMPWSSKSWRTRWKNHSMEYWFLMRWKCRVRCVCHWHVSWPSVDWTISLQVTFQFCFHFSHLSSNDRWCGILKSTTSFVLPLVQMSCVVCNVYELLDADFHTHQTTYVLQFMWRDITSDFEVIGPYFTSEKSLEMKFLAACLFEAMYVFETYNFHILGLICDGSSCNLALLKRFCDTSGR